MIGGIGVDIVDIEQMEKSLQIPGFLHSIFTSDEIKNEHGNSAEYYATRFACKEAVSKALQISFDWRTIEILNKEDGKTYVVLKEMYNVTNIHIDISMADGIAIAYCVVEL